MIVLHSDAGLKIAKKGIFQSYGYLTQTKEGVVTGSGCGAKVSSTRCTFMAECEALTEAIKLLIKQQHIRLKQQHIRLLRCYCDNKTLVEVINGHAKAKSPELRHALNSLKQIQSNVSPISLQVVWLSRKENKAADKLATHALDLLMEQPALYVVAKKAWVRFS